jgi:hypothetical protein
VRTFFLLLVYCSATLTAFAQETIEWNTPSPVLHAIQRPEFKTKFDLSSLMNPFYVRGDFDRDGKPDYAFMIVNKGNGKRGIGVLLSSRRAVVILGAGSLTRAGAAEVDDFNWIDSWEAIEMRTVETWNDEKIRIVRRGDGILVAKNESASGIYYWDGRRFRWLQQGD